MSMKLSTAKVIGDILLAMRINRLSDKEAKAVLMKDYLAIRKAVKDVNGDCEEIARKFREDWAEEFVKPDKSEAFKKAQGETNADIMKLYERDAEISLDAIPASLLFDAELWGEDNTIGQIANTVDFLAANGIAKED